MDKNGGIGGIKDDLLVDQDDDLPFGGELDDLEINFVDDEPQAQTQETRKGQNEDPDFYAGDTGDDDELEGASEAVRSRVMRERRQRAEDNRRLTAELERAEEAILLSERQKAAAQRDSFKIGIDALDVRMHTAREALKAARVDGDVGAETEIEAQIRQIEKIRGEIEANLARVPSDEAIQQAFNQHRERVRSERSRQGDDEGRPLNTLAQRWADRNTWMDDPRNADAKKTLVQASQMIAKEGLDPSSPEHFTELTRRMAKAFPNLAIKDLAGRQLGGTSQGQPQNSRRVSTPPPVGGNRGTPPMSNNPRNQKQVNLDLSDKRMMRTVGLDPTNKKHVAAFAREKLTRLQTESRNR